MLAALSPRNQMLRWMLALTFSISCFTMAVRAAQPLRAGGGLTGTWNVSVTPDDANQAGAKPFDEVLTFKGDQFTTKKLADRGYGSVHYEEDTRPGGAAQFTANPTSEKEGKA